MPGMGLPGHDSPHFYEVTGMSNIFDTWSELDLLTGLIYGEARSEGWAGKGAVGLVVRNRVAKPGFWNWGRNWREVILAPKQFSCFNPNDVNREKIVKAKKDKGARWEECCHIAEIVYVGRLVDRIGADHYHTVICRPSWTANLIFLCQIGDHRFYRVS